MPSVLITGANRGIGLGLARHYSGLGWRVVATCRRPERAIELAALAGDIRILCLDVADPESIDAAARQFGDEPLDLLVNNAGILRRSSAGKGRTAEGLPEAFDAAGWLAMTEVNALGPLRVTLAFLSNLLRSAEPKMILIGTHVRDFDAMRAQAPDLLGYGASKVAANALLRGLEAELRACGVKMAALHPGMVRTDMGHADAPLGIDDSAAAVAAVVAGLGAGTSGRFLRHDGGEVAW